MKCALCRSCAPEMERWLEDLRMAVDLAEQSSGSHADLLSPADNSESAAFRPLESRQIVFACPLFISFGSWRKKA